MQSLSARRLLSSSALATTTTATRITTLARDDPLVKKLFRPYIAADFEGPEPLISQTELRDLRRLAMQFGVDPTALNLPEPTDPLPIQVDDKRRMIEMARLTAIHKKKMEKKREKIDSEREQQLKQRRLSPDEIDRDYRERVAEWEDELQTIQLPLRLRSKAEQEEYWAKKRGVVSGLMEGMDKRLAEARTKRVDRRQAARQAIKKF
jgi:hypothetical protein